MTNITIPSDCNFISNAYELVETKAKELGLNEGDIYDVKLATDEAITNIILHGYGDRSGNVRVDVKQLDDKLIVVLTDSGPPYDPTVKVDPDLTTPLSDRKKGGMGVYLMKKNMDEVTYKKNRNGNNELTMLKRKTY